MTPSACNPTEVEFEELAARSKGNVVPLVFRFPNDFLTAPAVFQRVEQANRHAFFLESVETGEKIGRYSFIGCAPTRILSFSEGTFTVTDGEGKEVRKEEGGDPLDLLRGFMGELSSESRPGLPPFLGGAVGYLGYDCAHHFEPTIGKMKADEIGMPEMMWMVPDLLIVFDHPMSQIFLVRPCRVGDGESPAEAYRAGRKAIEGAIEDYLVMPSFEPPDVGRAMAEERGIKVEEPTGRFSREDYARIIEKAKRHIREGDIFQMVPSQRYRLEADFHPYDVYRRLRHLNPSPYMFYLKFGDTVVCGSSPEVMVRCIGDDLTLKPIAGTKPRGATPEEDGRYERELMADEKELAEHMMLVDLGRNDLGRVAEIGTVSVDKDELMVVEHYSHVMHIVTTVRAKLREGLSAFDAVRATFPAGTLSGAPKIRAMQIINEVEPVRRNVYGGLCGYFGFDGSMDSCIALRMMVVRDGKAYVQAGGGLVADSDPDAEYQEILNKAGAVLRAIRLTRG